MRPWILGISASHNGAYCLLHGDSIEVAIQEERLTGVKRDRVHGSRRGLGIGYCLDAAGIAVSDLTMVVLSCQRSARIEENDIWCHPSFGGLTQLRRVCVSHHLAHAASTFATSGYESAAVLVADGVGSPVEDLCDAARRVVIDPCKGAFEHASLFHARRNSLAPLEIHVADQWLRQQATGMWRFASLGGMYSAVAQQIFGDYMEAGKVMGLAPYGEACIPVDEFLRFDGDRLVFTNLVQLRFNHRDRWPAHRREYEDLAASAQRALEAAMLRFAARLRECTSESNLCLAGGVGLNSVANQKICLESGFDHVHIVPSAEDSGVAIGAAFLGLWELGAEYSPIQLRTDGLGRRSTAPEIEAAIREVPDIVASQPRDLLGETTRRLENGEIGGWFQGGSELGPRALGYRSILCSPCGRDAKSILNARVKHREAFRPFAPAVLVEHAQDWFEFGSSSVESPFMLRVVPFKEGRREQVPAVVHVDGSGRVQTLSAENGIFYELVQRFYSSTGVPMLLNTSMNVQSEPIVETPVDALWCLLGTDLQFCVIHDWLITKREGAHGILSYVPAVVAEEYTLRMGVVAHALQRRISRDDAISVRVATPWGKVNAVLPPRLMPLLREVDGRRNGHEVLMALPDESLRRTAVRDLLLLRRMHVLQFLSPVGADKPAG